jgi:CheY-like chemotaxis protein
MARGAQLILYMDGSDVTRLAGSGLSRTHLPKAMRVLVVDDDVDIREPLVELFESEGYQVSAAANGLEALGEARRNRPDVILLDLTMPVMSGEEFRAEQSRDPSLSGVPVVTISASADDAKASPFLRKPFHIQEVLDVVRHLSVGGG